MEQLHFDAGDCTKKTIRTCYILILVKLLMAMTAMMQSKAISDIRIHNHSTLVIKDFGMNKS